MEHYHDNEQHQELEQRQQVLRGEYIQIFRAAEPSEDLTDEALLREHLPALMMDLIERDKKEEFVGENTTGAHFWGGHYYLQTVQEITGIEMEDIWKVVEVLHHDKRIQLEGMVVQEYTEPPAPRWNEYGRLTVGDIMIVAEFPAHSRMSHLWRYNAYDMEGQLLVGNVPGAPLMHEPLFGVDSDDVAMAEREMQELAELIKRKRDEGYLTKREMIQRDAGRNTDVE